MKPYRRALGLGLLALWVGCADFEKAEQSFCERNPDRCEEQTALSELAFTTAPQQVQVGSCSDVVTVQLREARGGPAQVKADTVVELSVTPAEGLQFFTDAGCAGAPVTAVTIPTGASSASFYFQGARVGAATLSASASALSGSQEVTLTPIPPTALAVELPASSVMAGTCTSGKIQVKGENGATTLVSTATPVGLEVVPTTSVDFYSDASCTTPAPGVTLAAQQGEASFYFLGRVSGRVTISASAQGLAPASQSVELSPGAGPRLVVVTPPQVAEAGACSSAVLVQSQDAQGNAVPTSAPTAIMLAATPSAGFRFYSNAACTSEVTGAQLAEGTTNASFYFKGTKSGNVTVTVTAPGYTGSSQAETITPGPPSLVALTGPRTVPAGDCSAQASLELRDAQGNPTAARANTALTLSASGVSLSFFTDSECESAATGVTVSQGATSGAFYFRGVQAGSSVLAAASSGLTSGTLNVTIAPSAASVLTFTTGAQTVPAGSCSAAVTVQAGPPGNPLPVASAVPVSLSAAPPAGFTFFTSASCNVAATQVIIPQGQSSAVFYFRGTQAGTPTVTASSTGLTSATQGQAITAGAPSVLRFTTPSYATAAGSCSPRVTLQSTDAFGNPSPVAANTSLNLSHSFGSTSDSQFQFYSDAGCTAPVTQVPLPAGQSSVGFYYRGVKAQQVALQAFASGLSGSAQQHTLTPAAASTLRFSLSTPPQTLLAGTCALRTVESRDPYDNPGANALSLNLSASASARFYRDAACTVPTSQVSIAAGSSSASFYFKGLTGGLNAVGELTLRASSAGLTPATQLESILPTVRTGECSMSSSSTSTGCPMSLPVSDLNRAFLVFQATTTNPDSGMANVRCFLDGTGELKCERADLGSPVNIRWSVAEFPMGVATQHFTRNCSGYVSLSPQVRMESSFLLLSSSQQDSGQVYRELRLAELISPFEARIQKSGGCNTGEANHLQVVEYPGASVQRGRIDFTSGPTTQIDLPTPVAPDRSILLYSYYTGGSSSRSCEHMVRGELLSEGRQARFSRGDGEPFNCSNSAIQGLSWEVVQFPPGTVVQQVTQRLAESSATVTLPIPVDLSRTLVIAGGQWTSGQLHGEGSYSNGDVPSEARAQASLANNSTLKITRETALGSATFTVYVIQLEP